MMALLWKCFTFPYIISRLNSLRARYSSEISLMVSSEALLPDYSHDLMTGYVINIHSCLKDINCNVCSSAKFLPAANSKLNPFTAVFIHKDIIRIFSRHYASSVVCSAFKWIPWSLPAIWGVACMGEFCKVRLHLNLLLSNYCRQLLMCSISCEEALLT